RPLAGRCAYAPLFRAVTAQQVERIVELDIVLGLRRDIGGRTGTVVTLLRALDVATQLRFAARDVATRQILRQRLLDLDIGCDALDRTSTRLNSSHAKN